MQSDRAGAPDFTQTLCGMYNLPQYLPAPWDGLPKTGFNDRAFTPPRCRIRTFRGLVLVHPFPRCSAPKPEPSSRHFPECGPGARGDSLEWIWRCDSLESVARCSRAQSQISTHLERVVYDERQPLGLSTNAPSPRRARRRLRRNASLGHLPEPIMRGTSHLRLYLPPQQHGR